MKRMTIALALSALVIAGCDAGPADGAGGTLVDPDAPAETPAPAPDDAPTPDESGDAAETSAEGTRTNPAAIGATARIGDWEVTITDVDLDATEVVLEENQFNDGPADGRSFVLWSIEATYNGDDSGTAWIDLNWKVVGAAGNSFGSGMDDSCGVVPDDLFSKGETFPGGVVTGNVCVSAETDQLDGGTILVEELFGGSRTFFALP